MIIYIILYIPIYMILSYISLLQIQATVFKYDICSSYLKNFS